MKRLILTNLLRLGALLALTIRSLDAPTFGVGRLIVRRVIHRQAPQPPGRQ